MVTVNGNSAPPVVSVVLPTRDRLDLLRRAVGSALGQADVEVEVIVVDDGSTDGTQAWLAAQEDPRLRVELSPSPHGVARARNLGIEAARGEWVAFLDDDDFWAPTYLSEQVGAARRAGAALAAASAIVVSADRRPLQLLWAPQDQDLASAVFAENVFGGPSRVVVRADALRETGGFDPALAVLADWDLWIRFLHVHRATVTIEPLVAITLHSRNMQVTRVQAIEREIEIILAKHSSGAASAGETIGSAELYRWLARQYRRAGLRIRAARTYLSIARRYRQRDDVLRGLGVLLGERLMGMTRPSATLEYVPEWLEEAGSASAATASPLAPPS